MSDRAKRVAKASSTFVELHGLGVIIIKYNTSYYDLRSNSSK